MVFTVEWLLWNTVDRFGHVLSGKVFFCVGNHECVLKCVAVIIESLKNSVSLL